MKPIHHNWHIFLTIRHINGLRRMGKNTPELENMRNEISMVLKQSMEEMLFLESNDFKSISESGFRKIYPPITK